MNGSTPGRLIARDVPSDLYLPLRHGAVVNYGLRKARLNLKTVQHISGGGQERHVELDFNEPNIGEVTDDFSEILSRIGFQPAFDGELL